MMITKMDMIWVAIADLIRPNIDRTHTVSRRQIERKVAELWGETITAVMIERHLISSEDRMAKAKYPQSGGSRNRYLFKTLNGSEPDGKGNFRLSKAQDREFDGWDKTGKLRPERDEIEKEFWHLLDWHEDAYYSI